MNRIEAGCRSREHDFDRSTPGGAARDRGNPARTPTAPGKAGGVAAGPQHQPQTAETKTAVVAIGDVHRCVTVLREAVWPHLDSATELMLLGN